MHLVNAWIVWAMMSGLDPALFGCGEGSCCIAAMYPNDAVIGWSADELAVVVGVRGC